MRVSGLARGRRADCLHCRVVAGAGHLGSDSAQFDHDLAMHGTDIAVSGRLDRQLAEDCFFDTKTSAMNRHEIFPYLHSSSFTQMRFNTGFTPGTVVKRAARRHTPTINHAHPPFTEN